MAETKQTRLITEDNQYVDLRSANCATAGSNVKVIRRIGVDDDVMACASNITWFEQDKDFNITTYEPGTISFDREEVISNVPLKQTSANDNSMEWALEIVLMGSYGSKYGQRIQAMMAEEFASGRNGAGLIALANGKIHFQEELILNEGMPEEARQKTTYLNLKISEMSVPNTGIITSETEMTQSFLVENYPVYEYSGDWSTYATPEGLTPVTASATSGTLTDTELTLVGLTLIDTDGLIDPSITNPIEIALYDSATGTKLVEGTFPATNPSPVTMSADFSTVDEVILSGSYRISPNMSFIYRTVPITKTATL